MCITNHSLYHVFESNAGYLALDENKELSPMVTPCEDCNYMVHIQRASGSWGYLAYSRHNIGYAIDDRKSVAMVSTYRDIKFSLHTMLIERSILSYSLRVVLSV